jgi:hypothetical protein
MSKIKGNMSVLKAAEKAYSDMPTHFSGLELHKRAALYMGRPSVYPDTVLRALRELRQDGKIDFTCTDHTDSIYQKNIKDTLF